MEAVVEKQEQEIDELRRLLDGLPEREFGKVTEDGVFCPTSPMEHLARSALDRIERAIVELSFFKQDDRIRVVMADLQGILDEASPILAEHVEKAMQTVCTGGSEPVIETVALEQESEDNSEQG